MKPTRAIDRRTFLRRAAAPASLAAAFPAIVPSSVLGQNAPSNRITLASLGVGGRGTGVMRGFARHGDAQFLAVCDPFAARREQARSTLEQQYGKGTVTAYADFREVLARADIDAVVICTPDHWHVPLAIAAGKSGNDMYVEKPLGVSVEWAKVLRDVVRRYGNVFQYGTQQRSNWQFRFACELARNGYLGAVEWVDVWCPHLGSGAGRTASVPIPDGFDYDLWLGPAPWAPYCDGRTHWNFRWILDYSGGQVTDWGAHHIDIAHWGLGLQETGPIEVEGEGEFPPDGLWNAAVNYRFECLYGTGVRILVTNRFENGVKWEGDDGWVFVSRGRIDAHPKSLLEEEMGPADVHLPRSPGHHRNFLDCVRSRQEPIAPIEQAHRTITAAHLGNIAMQLGRKVRWDPAAERFVDDPQAERMRDRAMREPWRL